MAPAVILLLALAQSPVRVTNPAADPVKVTCNNCSSAGGAGTTIDGGRLGAVDWLDGGTVDQVLSVQWIDGGNINVIQTTSPWVSNVTQFGSSNVLTGTGTAGAGVPRVTVSNDSMIGIDGGQVQCNAGTNLNTSLLSTAANQTTLGSQTTKLNDGTTTAGVIAGTTALKTDLSSVAGTATSTAAAGVAKVGIVGNTGAAVDAVIGNATAPTNQVVTGAVFNTTLPTLTTGQSAAVQANSRGEQLVQIGDGTTNVAVIAGTTALKTDMSSVAGTATVTAAAGVQKVGIVGNANAAIDAANNAAAPANVLVAGAQLQSGAAATNGTAGQVGNLVAGLDHVLYTRPGGPVVWSCFVQAVTATTQCQAAPAAGLRAYVTGVSCSNQAATAQTVDIVYGTGAACVTGTTALTHKHQMGTNATTTSPFESDLAFSTPLVPAAANAICLRPSAATAFGCTLTGFTAP